jgi:uncharacterized lipoprotein YmbA
MMRIESICLLAAAVLLGCANPPSPPSLHSLAAEAPQAATAGASERPNYQAVIAQVGVPESVDRPQLIVQRGGSIELVDSERWAEPLKRAIPRLLAADLMQRLDGVTVWSMPGTGPTRPDARISVEINRFESLLGKESAIEALWLIRAGGVERSGRTVAQTPASSNGYDALVAAHRAGLLQVSRDIAQALRLLVAAAP